MKSLLSVLLASLLLAGVSFGQVTDTTQVTATAGSTATTNKNRLRQQQAPAYKKVYFGGYMSLTVGSYTRIGVYPLLGYKFTPKLSGGLKIGYEYVSDKRYTSIPIPHPITEEAYSPATGSYQDSMRMWNMNNSVMNYTILMEPQTVNGSPSFMWVGVIANLLARMCG